MMTFTSPSSNINNGGDSDVRFNNNFYLSYKKLASYLVIIQGGLVVYYDGIDVVLVIGHLLVLTIVVSYYVSFSPMIRQNNIGMYSLVSESSLKRLLQRTSTLYYFDHYRPRLFQFPPSP